MVEEGFLRKVAVESLGKVTKEFSERVRQRVYLQIEDEIIKKCSCKRFTVEFVKQVGLKSLERVTKEFSESVPKRCFERLVLVAFL